MKYILSILFAVVLSLQAKALPLDEPTPFEKFYKKQMKVTPGLFTVYQDGSNYFLEIPASTLNTDLLVIGDIARGFANNIAQSSGVIRFGVGNGNVLNVTKEVYKEETSADFNQGFEELVQKSNLTPVSYVIPVVARGKDKKSYIIELTHELIEGGNLFSFKDFSDLSSSDPARSGVQEVKASGEGVVFSVLRTQTVPGNSVNGSKAVDKAVAFVLNLGLQRLPVSKMKVRESDPRIGFATVAYNDFGKYPYGVRNVKVITKWNLNVRPADQQKYNAGVLVTPAKAITVYIDKNIPALFVPYVKQGIAQWNAAFEKAGFKEVLVLAKGENENWLSAGKIQIKWGGGSSDVQVNLLSDPRTGEIYTAKMNISDQMVNDLLPSYFTKCSMKDLRILTDLYNPEVRGEMMRWKVAQAMGEVLGMVPNLHGSSAYTPAQLRSGNWLKQHSFSSSVTDDTQFNFLVQPEDDVAVTDLMPRVSAYDELAIGWAYRVFADRNAEKKSLASLKPSNAALMFLEENKSDPFTRRGDVSSDQLEAAELAMNNLMRFYPQVEKVSAEMKGGDDDWRKFKLLSSAYQKNFQLYTDNVASYIGGTSLRPVLRNYNEVPVVYTTKKDQKKAMALLNNWFFSGVPSWMQNKRMNLENNESEDTKMQNSMQDLLRKLISPEVLNNLIKAEHTMGNQAYTSLDLFEDLDRYVFKDFDSVNPLNEHTKLMQSKFIFDLADATVKNNFAAGLSDSSEVIHFYFVRTMKHIKELAERHQDPKAKALYQMLREKVEKGINQKKG
nr:zinc-dependent metalloprotease [uncultured Pedobacter sp.]